MDKTLDESGLDGRKGERAGEGGLTRTRLLTNLIRRSAEDAGADEKRAVVVQLEEGNPLPWDEQRGALT
jgi:hypothetical protein